MRKEHVKQICQSLLDEALQNHLAELQFKSFYLTNVKWQKLLLDKWILYSLYLLRSEECTHLSSNILSKTIVKNARLRKWNVSLTIVYWKPFSSQVSDNFYLLKELSKIYNVLHKEELQFLICLKLFIFINEFSEDFRRVWIEIQAIASEKFNLEEVIMFLKVAWAEFQRNPHFKLNQ